MFMRDFANLVLIYLTIPIYLMLELIFLMLSLFEDTLAHFILTQLLSFITKVLYFCIFFILQNCIFYVLDTK